MAQLPTTERIAYKQKRDAINSSYSNQVARVTAQRGRLDLDEQLGWDRMLRQQTQQRQQLPGGFVGRGMFSSGFYQRGLSDLNTNFMDARGDWRRDFARKRGDLAQSLADLDANRVLQMANVDLTEAARRAAMASIIGSTQ